MKIVLTTGLVVASVATGIYLEKKYQVSEKVLGFGDRFLKKGEEILEEEEVKEEKTPSKSEKK